MTADSVSATPRFPDRHALVRAAVFVVGINVLGSVPGILSGPGSAWFQGLEKPWFYPPGIAFPVVWTALFTLLGVALWLVWRSDAPGRRLALGLFALQMVFNIAWNARNHVPR